SPKKQFRIRDKGMVLIGLPLLAQALLIGTLTTFLYQANIQIDRQSHARKIAEVSQNVLRNLDDSAILVFLCAGLPETPGLYKDQYKKIDAVVAEFKKVSIGDPARIAAAEAVAKAAGKINKLQSSLIEVSKTEVLSLNSVAESVVKDYIAAWNEMSVAVNEVATREGQLESNGTQSIEEIAAHLNQLLVFGLAVNFLCAIGLTVYLTKNITDRIAKVQINAERILLKQELLPPVTGTDEIAYLDTAFHDAAQSLKEEQELKRQLLAIASHELRSPLAAILMTLGTLSAGVMGELTPKTSERIAQAEIGTERLVALINDILDIEKMEAGKFVLSLEDLSVRSVVERAVACVEPLCSRRKIIVENRVEDLQVKGEAERLIQVLVNLVSNAIKFSDDGQTIVVSSKVKDGKDLLIQVKDSGRGIPPEMQERIFERFVASQEEENRNGTGLGLPISKAIIEQHGGLIGFESSKGEGSMFWFSLPLSITIEKAETSIQMMN
ncbi:MAG: HAMP domain-containing histidine kinase, partial [Candidatus Obscuribacterales bacterium]|nr:HAMP domain-containing histidine kinase [Candidatus Obscuribacterales bacterium]